ncbi:MAG TPA: 30S ribosomal protein S2 [Patescibacteria group bacterium]|nr:30S ribosomal protein S2 [Patescibacteria group bacterium]
MKKSDPEELMQHGLHFGHKKERLHPRFKKYIYGVEKGVALIDLFKTADLLDRAIQYLADIGKAQKELLVVSTKKQLKTIVEELCKAHGVHFVTTKWIGGFLTNFEKVSKNIEKLLQLKKEKEEGAWNKFPKHERVKLEKQLTRMIHMYEGTEKLKKAPDVFCIIDIKQEETALKEARTRGTPIVAVVDTNCNPDMVTYPVPANDDASSSVSYVLGKLLGSYSAGRKAVS